MQLVSNQTDFSVHNIPCYFTLQFLGLYTNIHGAFKNSRLVETDLRKLKAGCVDFGEGLSKAETAPSPPPLPKGESMAFTSGSGEQRLWFPVIQTEVEKC